MLRSYFLAAVRNLLRNRLYAGLTIAGLALGFAAAILVGLYVREELTYDRFIPGHEDVYLVSQTITPPSRAAQKINVTEIWTAPLLKDYFPQIQQTARLNRSFFSPAARHGQVEATEQNFFWADSAIFEVLPLPVVAGDLRHALDAPNSLVVTRSVARKYFGRDAPIGETLFIDDHPMRITAVLKDLPSNTHLAADLIGASSAPWSTTKELEAMNRPGSMTSNTLTYLRMKPGASVDAVQSGLARFLEEKLPLQAAIIQVVGRPKRSAHLTPLIDIHLKGGGVGDSKPAGDIGVISAIGVIGAMIVVIAAINFVTMMTARAGRRALEVGVRKAAGATRRDLIIQFLGEAVLYVVLSMLLAAALAELLLPAVNAALGRRMTFAYLTDPSLALSLAGAAVLVGLLAGAYPALVLSSFAPATVLKGGLSAQGGAAARVRQGLVIAQFAILIALVIMTATIVRQTWFGLNEATRIDKEQVLMAFGQGCTESFRNQVRAMPGVRSAACTSSFALGMSSSLSKVLVGGKSADIDMAPVDFGFFEVFGIEPLAGRLLQEDRSQDALHDNPAALSSVVINETAARRLGFATPQAAVGQTIDWGGPPRADFSRPDRQTAEIIGVVPDFSFQNAKSQIPPVMYFIGAKTRLFSIALVAKLDGTRTPEIVRDVNRLWKRLGGQGPMITAFADQYMLLQYKETLVQGGLIATCALLALFIACLGLFAMSTYTAEQRTKEIGVRKAMGASAPDILRLLLVQFSRPVLWANLIAWPLAFLVMQRWLEGFAYHVDQPLWAFPAAGAIALAIAWLTVSMQSIKVARAKPVTALRYE